MPADVATGGQGWTGATRGATMAAMAGATLADLQQRLGHSSVNAALRYQHAAQGRDRQIAEALSRLSSFPGQ